MDHNRARTRPRQDVSCVTEHSQSRNMPAAQSNWLASRLYLHSDNQGDDVITRQPTASLAGLLWSDEPAEVDLLAARAIAETVADAVLDDALDPLSLGLSGPWGSGKTTVLELIEDDLEARAIDPTHGWGMPTGASALATSRNKVLVVRTDRGDTTLRSAPRKASSPTSLTRWPPSLPGTPAPG